MNARPHKIILSKIKQKHKGSKLLKPLPVHFGKFTGERSYNAVFIQAEKEFLFPCRFPIFVAAQALRLNNDQLTISIDH